MLRVGFFDWEVVWGRILKLDQLKRRGWKIQNKCYLCIGEEKIIDGILFCCMKAIILW